MSRQPAKKIAALSALLVQRVAILGSREPACRQAPPIALPSASRVAATFSGDSMPRRAADHVAAA